MNRRDILKAAVCLLAWRGVKPAPSVVLPVAIGPGEMVCLPPGWKCHQEAVPKLKCFRGLDMEKQR